MQPSICHCLTGGMFDGGVLVLRAAQLSYLVGRGPSADITLPATPVSRRHARIYWSGRDDAWFVRDLGSQNGTRMRGVVIERPTRLEDHAVIGIGPFEIRYRRYWGDLDVLLREQRVDDETTRAMVLGEGAMISGTFREDELIEFCQFLAFHEKFGLLRLRTTDGDPAGEILFDQARISYGRDPAGAGLAAIRRLLSLQEGTFEFHSPPPPDLVQDATFSPVTAMGLLMDLAREGDETPPHP